MATEIAFTAKVPFKNHFLIHFRFVSVNDVYAPTDDGSKSKVWVTF